MAGMMLTEKEFVSRLEAVPVVPLLKAEDPATAVAMAQALAIAGITVVEVVLRTDRALQGIEAIARAVPELVVGAGTVLDAEQAGQVLDHGAGFIVSPGLDEDVVSIAKSRSAPVLPGVATASEFLHAHKLGLGMVKFFPASIAGGVAAIKAFASVFRQMRIFPTGGVSSANLADYLAIPSVIACGGSWLTPAAAVSGGDFLRLTELAREARSIATQTKT